MNNPAFDVIHVPVLNDLSATSRPVLVAVVDDGFRLTHKELRDFIYYNPLENGINHRDDDGNGFVDDVAGWDVSDDDNDVSVPDDRRKEFYHGTYVASIIAHIANLAYGENASGMIKILPVKALSDNAEKSYLSDGYKGIKYAMEAGADIIVCAWNGGFASEEEKTIIREANSQGILVVAAAGNLSLKDIPDPAGLPGVLAVAGVDHSMNRETHTNYGTRVDISAPGFEVPGAHPDRDNAYIKENGTSAATAIVSGVAAILISKSGKKEAGMIRSYLLNGSTPFPSTYTVFGGKLGAGVVNLEKSLGLMDKSTEMNPGFSSLRSKGNIKFGKETGKMEYSIHPAGSFEGFYLESSKSGLKKDDKVLQILTGDSIWNSYTLNSLPPRIFVPATYLDIKLSGSKFRKNEHFNMEYYGKTLDSTTLYCEGETYLEGASGELEDGSGTDDYSGNCSCKWIITVPEGRKVKITFTELETEPNVDYVYLFSGNSALPENIIAKFSGSNIPPVVSSGSNQVLIWFVSDAKKNGAGWKLNFEAVETGQFLVPENIKPKQ